MHRCSFLRVALCWICLGLLGHKLHAAELARRAPRPAAQRTAALSEKVPSDDGRFRLTEASGPWMIFAASFVGDGAHEDALALAKELRKLKMKAYLHSQSYDFSQPVQGLGLDPHGNPRKMKFRNFNKHDEWAVLVGDYSSVDDIELKNCLNKIKYMHPDSIDADTTLRYAGLRQMQKMANKTREKNTKGPLGHAFATPNPLVPPVAVAPQGIDSLVVKMNKGLKYSLLDCKQDYSVRIATFRGKVIIDQKEIMEIEQNSIDMDSRLDDAANKANRLVQQLRRKGVEAYQYHDRYASYVTVGSFDSLGKVLSDGKTTELDPAIHQIMEKYGPQKKPVVSKTGNQEFAMVPQVLEGVHLDVQPYPMEVPRYSVAADYGRSE